VLEGYLARFIFVTGSTQPRPLRRHLRLGQHDFEEILDTLGEREQIELI
jgi:hypothetical protein